MQTRLTNTPKDYLKHNLRDLPYFRALLRAVESRFYQNLEFNNPTLDLGTGDGHFANSTFTKKINFGIDPNLLSLMEAKKVDAYDFLINASGAEIPVSSNHFKTVVSNSVLEHIFDVDLVLKELNRVTKADGFFYFSVPNQNFSKNLSIARIFEVIHLNKLADLYRKLFNYISRHYHCLSQEEWKNKLAANGFKVIKCWNFFSINSLAVLEWGHYVGLPYLISKKILNQWVLFPELNQTLIYECLKRSYFEQPICDEGAYTFYICQKFQ